MAPYGQIFVIKKTGGDGSCFPLLTNTCKIGRGHVCDIRIQRDGVAEEHCLIQVRKDSQVWIRNLSENETSICGTPLSTDWVALKHLDMILIADRVFRWEYLPQSNFYRETVASSHQGLEINAVGEDNRISWLKSLYSEERSSPKSQQKSKDTLSHVGCNDLISFPDSPHLPVDRSKVQEENQSTFKNELLSVSKTPSSKKLNEKKTPKSSTKQQKAVEMLMSFTPDVVQKSHGKSRRTSIMKSTPHQSFKTPKKVEFSTLDEELAVKENLESIHNRRDSSHSKGFVINEIEAALTVSGGKSSKRTSARRKSGVLTSSISGDVTISPMFSEDDSPLTSRSSRLENSSFMKTNIASAKSRGRVKSKEDFSMSNIVLLTSDDESMLIPTTPKDFVTKSRDMKMRSRRYASRFSRTVNDSSNTNNGAAGNEDGVSFNESSAEGEVSQKHSNSTLGTGYDHSQTGNPFETFDASENVSYSVLAVSDSPWIVMHGGDDGDMKKSGRTRRSGVRYSLSNTSFASHSPKKSFIHCSTPAHDNNLGVMTANGESAKSSATKYKGHRASRISLLLESKESFMNDVNKSIDASHCGIPAVTVEAELTQTTPNKYKKRKSSLNQVKVVAPTPRNRSMRKSTRGIHTPAYADCLRNLLRTPRHVTSENTPQASDKLLSTSNSSSQHGGSVYDSSVYDSALDQSDTIMNTPSLLQSGSRTSMKSLRSFSSAINDSSTGTPKLRHSVQNSPRNRRISSNFDTVDLEKSLVVSMIGNIPKSLEEKEEEQQQSETSSAKAGTPRKLRSSRSNTSLSIVTTPNTQKDMSKSMIDISNSCYPDTPKELGLRKPNALNESVEGNKKFPDKDMNSTVSQTVVSSKTSPTDAIGNEVTWCNETPDKAVVDNQRSESMRSRRYRMNHSVGTPSLESSENHKGGLFSTPNYGESMRNMLQTPKESVMEDPLNFKFRGWNVRSVATAQENQEPILVSRSNLKDSEINCSSNGEELISGNKSVQGEVNASIISESLSLEDSLSLEKTFDSAKSKRKSSRRTSGSLRSLGSPYRIKNVCETQGTENGRSLSQREQLRRDNVPLLENTQVLVPEEKFSEEKAKANLSDMEAVKLSNVNVTRRLPWNAKSKRSQRFKNLDSLMATPLLNASLRKKVTQLSTPCYGESLRYLMQTPKESKCTYQTASTRLSMTQEREESDFEEDQDSELGSFQLESEVMTDVDSSGVGRETSGTSNGMSLRNRRSSLMEASSLNESLRSKANCSQWSKIYDSSLTPHSSDNSMNKIATQTDTPDCVEDLRELRPLPEEAGVENFIDGGIDTQPTMPEAEESECEDDEVSELNSYQLEGKIELRTGNAIVEPVASNNSDRISLRNRQSSIEEASSPCKRTSLKSSRKRSSIVNDSFTATPTFGKSMKKNTSQAEILSCGRQPQTTKERLDDNVRWSASIKGEESEEVQSELSELDSSQVDEDVESDIGNPVEEAETSAMSGRVLRRNRMSSMKETPSSCEPLSSKSSRKRVSKSNDSLLATPSFDKSVERIALQAKTPGDEESLKDLWKTPKETSKKSVRLSSKLDKSELEEGESSELDSSQVDGEVESDIGNAVEEAETTATSGRVSRRSRMSSMKETPSSCEPLSSKSSRKRRSKTNDSLLATPSFDRTLESMALQAKTPGYVESLKDLWKTPKETSKKSVRLSSKLDKSELEEGESSELDSSQVDGVVESVIGNAVEEAETSAMSGRVSRRRRISSMKEAPSSCEPLSSKSSCRRGSKSNDLLLATPSFDKSMERMAVQAKTPGDEESLKDLWKTPKETSKKSVRLSSKLDKSELEEGELSELDSSQVDGDVASDIGNAVEEAETTATSGRVSRRSRMSSMKETPSSCEPLSSKSSRKRVSKSNDSLSATPSFDKSLERRALQAKTPGDDESLKDLWKTPKETSKKSVRLSSKLDKSELEEGELSELDSSQVDGDVASDIGNAVEEAETTATSGRVSRRSRMSSMKETPSSCEPLSSKSSRKRVSKSNDSLSATPSFDKTLESLALQAKTPGYEESLKDLWKTPKETSKKSVRQSSKLDKSELEEGELSELDSSQVDGDVVSDIGNAVEEAETTATSGRVSRRSRMSSMKKAPSSCEPLSSKSSRKRVSKSNDSLSATPSFDKSLERTTLQAKTPGYEEMMKDLWRTPKETTVESVRMSSKMDNSELEEGELSELDSSQVDGVVESVIGNAVEEAETSAMSGRLLRRNRMSSMKEAPSSCEPLSSKSSRKRRSKTNDSLLATTSFDKYLEKIALQAKTPGYEEMLKDLWRTPKETTVESVRLSSKLDKSELEEGELSELDSSQVDGDVVSDIGNAVEEAETTATSGRVSRRSRMSSMKETPSSCEPLSSKSSRKRVSKSNDSLSATPSFDKTLESLALQAKTPGYEESLKDLWKTPKETSKKSVRLSSKLDKSELEEGELSELDSSQVDGDVVSDIGNAVEEAETTATSGRVSRRSRMSSMKETPSSCEPLSSKSSRKRVSKSNDSLSATPSFDKTLESLALQANTPGDEESLKDLWKTPKETSKKSVRLSSKLDKSELEEGELSELDSSQVDGDVVSDIGNAVEEAETTATSGRVSRRSRMSSMKETPSSCEPLSSKSSRKRVSKSNDSQSATPSFDKSLERRAFLAKTPGYEECLKDLQKTPKETSMISFRRSSNLNNVETELEEGEVLRMYSSDVNGSVADAETPTTSVRVSLRNRKSSMNEISSQHGPSSSMSNRSHKSQACESPLTVPTLKEFMRKGIAPRHIPISAQSGVVSGHAEWNVTRVSPCQHNGESLMPYDFNGSLFSTSTGEELDKRGAHSNDDPDGSSVSLSLHNSPSLQRMSISNTVGCLSFSEGQLPGSDPVYLDEVKATELDKESCIDGFVEPEGQNPTECENLNNITVVLSDSPSAISPVREHVIFTSKSTKSKKKEKYKTKDSLNHTPSCYESAKIAQVVSSTPNYGDSLRHMLRVSEEIRVDNVKPSKAMGWNISELSVTHKNEDSNLKNQSSAVLELCALEEELLSDVEHLPSEAEIPQTSVRLRSKGRNSSMKQAVAVTPLGHPSLRRSMKDLESSKHNESTRKTVKAPLNDNYENANTVDNSVNIEGNWQVSTLNEVPKESMVDVSGLSLHTSSMNGSLTEPLIIKTNLRSSTNVSINENWYVSKVSSAEESEEGTIGNTNDRMVMAGQSCTRLEEAEIDIAVQSSPLGVENCEISALPVVRNLSVCSPKSETLHQVSDSPKDSCVGISAETQNSVLAPISSHDVLEMVKADASSKSSPNASRDNILPTSSSYEDVTGVKVQSSKRSPHSEYTDFKGLKRLFSAKSPDCNYLDVSGIKSLFASPVHPSITENGNDSVLAVSSDDKIMSDACEGAPTRRTVAKLMKKQTKPKDIRTALQPDLSGDIINAADTEKTDSGISNRSRYSKRSKAKLPMIDESSTGNETAKKRVLLKTNKQNGKSLSSDITDVTPSIDIKPVVCGESIDLEVLKPKRINRRGMRRNKIAEIDVVDDKIASKENIHVDSHSVLQNECSAKTLDSGDKLSGNPVVLLPRLSEESIKSLVEECSSKSPVKTRRSRRNVSANDEKMKEEVEAGSSNKSKKGSSLNEIHVYEQSEINVLTEVSDSVKPNLKPVNQRVSRRNKTSEIITETIKYSATESSAVTKTIEQRSSKLVAKPRTLRRTEKNIVNIDNECVERGIASESATQSKVLKSNIKGSSSKMEPRKVVHFENQKEENEDLGEDSNEKVVKLHRSKELISTDDPVSSSDVLEVEKTLPKNSRRKVQPNQDTESVKVEESAATRLVGRRKTLAKIVEDAEEKLQADSTTEIQGSVEIKDSSKKVGSGRATRKKTPLSTDDPVSSSDVLEVEKTLPKNSRRKVQPKQDTELVKVEESAATRLVGRRKTLAKIVEDSEENLQADSTTEVQLSVEIKDSNKNVGSGRTTRKRAPLRSGECVPNGDGDSGNENNAVNASKRLKVDAGNRVEQTVEVEISPPKTTGTRSKRKATVLVEEDNSKSDAGIEKERGRSGRKRKLETENTKESKGKENVSALKGVECSEIEKPKRGRKKKLDSTEDEKESKDNESFASKGQTTRGKVTRATRIKEPDEIEEKAVDDSQKSTGRGRKNKKEEPEGKTASVAPPKKSKISDTVQKDEPKRTGRPRKGISTVEDEKDSLKEENLNTQSSNSGKGASEAPLTMKKGRRGAKVSSESMEKSPELKTSRRVLRKR